MGSGSEDWEEEDDIMEVVANKSSQQRIIEDKERFCTHFPPILNQSHYTVKKRFSRFLSPARMSLTKLSLAGNNVPNSSPRKFWSKKSRNLVNFLSSVFTYILVLYIPILQYFIF